MIQKKGIRALPKLIACTIILQEGAPTKLSKDSPKQKKIMSRWAFSYRGIPSIEDYDPEDYLAVKIVIQDDNVMGTG